MKNNKLIVLSSRARFNLGEFSSAGIRPLQTSKFFMASFFNDKLTLPSLRVHTQQFFFDKFNMFVCTCTEFYLCTVHCWPMYYSFQFTLTSFFRSRYRTCSKFLVSLPFFL